MVASERAFGARRSQVPRRRRRLSVTGLSAILAMVALAPRLGLAQSTSPGGQAPISLQPTIDGDPANPPRFRKPGTVARTPNGQTLPTGRFSNTTAPSRIGATPSFGSPPAFGAGDTGFDSSNDPRRKSKTRC